MKRKFSLCTLMACLTLFTVGCGGAALQPGKDPASEAQAATPTTSPQPKNATSDPAKADPKKADPGDIRPLHVEGRHLVDEQGAGVQLKGISSHGLSWYPQYVNLDMLTQMQQEWGANVFRLAMYTAEYNGYCVGDDANREALKQVIDRGVKASRELGMYLIIDWHILSDNNPKQNQQQAVAFFAEMAEKYKNESHILYEICNEPNGQTTWQDIKEYADAVIPVIREHTDAVILVGTPTWSQEIDKPAADPLTGYDNIMYTLHFYAATHKQELRDRMLNAANGGLPVFVSEFGICDASGNGAIDEAEAAKWLTAMNDAGISWAIWNLSNRAESSAMILPECSKESGFEEADLTQSGRWLVNNIAKK